MRQILILFFVIISISKGELFACSIVSIKSGNNLFIGRNFDWPKDGGEICFFKKSSTYINSQKIPSYSHLTLHQLGESMPYEGINEFGLFIGQTAINSIHASASFSFLKRSTTSLGIMKKVLERSRSVDEAIKVFNDYNILFGKFLGFPMIHYLVADKNGDSAIIEYVDGSLNVIKKNQKNFQLMTNFLLSEFTPGKAIEQKFFYRYRLANQFLIKDDQYDIKDVRSLIQMISVPKTENPPGIKLIFDEDKHYSFEEIQKTYLINQAGWSRIMEPFNQTESYSSEEIAQVLTDYFRREKIDLSYTIWTSLYSVKADQINIEVYYKRNWKTPRKFDFSKKLKNIQNNVYCEDMTQLFENGRF